MKHFLLASLFALFGAGCVLVVPLGLPGGWVLLATAVAVELLDSTVSGVPVVSFGWNWLLGVAAVLALGELAEFFGAAVGAKAGGATGRGVFGALVGGFLGALVGTAMIGLPIIGTLAGALVGAGFGAMFAELTRKGMTLRRSIKPAAGAVIGRVVGTILKLPFAIVAWIILVVLAYAS